MTRVGRFQGLRDGNLVPAFLDDHVLRGHGQQRRRQPGDIGQTGVLAPACGAAQPAQALDGGPLPRRDDREEVAISHHLHAARDRFDRGGIDRLEDRTVAGRSQHARVQHARQAQVVDVGNTPRDLRGNVDAGNGFRDDAVSLRILEARGGPDLNVELLALDELSVSDAAAVPRGDGAVLHGKRRHVRTNRLAARSRRISRA